MLNNIKNGFEFLKEKSTNIFNNTREDLNGTFEFARKINDGEEETPDRIFQDNRAQQDVNAFKSTQARLQESYPDDFKSVGDMENQFKSVSDIQTPNFDSEFQNKSIFGNRPETVLEGTFKGLPQATRDVFLGKQTNDELLESGRFGGVTGFAYDMATEIIRAPFSIANFASGKVGQGLNALTGNDTFDESTNNWVKGTSDYLGEVSPNTKTGFDAFFGLNAEEGLESEASVERSGKEYSDIINMILPERMDIKDGSNSMIAIGVIGSLLDTVPGSGGAKTSIKSILKNSKNVDEVIEALRFFTKSGSEEDIVKYATELFAKKGDNTFSLLGDLEKQDISESTIKFFKDTDGNIDEFAKAKAQDFAKRQLDEANLFENTKKTDTSDISTGGKQSESTPKTIDNAEEFLMDADALALDSTTILKSGTVDNMAENLVKKTDYEEKLANLIDEAGSFKGDVDEDLLKSLTDDISEVMNPKIANNLNQKDKLSLFEELAKKIDDVKYNKLKTGNLRDWYQGVKNGIYEAVDVSENFDVIAREITGTLAKKDLAIGNSIKAGQIDEAVRNSIEFTTIASGTGKVLNSVAEAYKQGAKIQSVPERLRRAIQLMKKEGMEPKDIVKAFEDGFKRKGINISEASVIDVDDVFSEAGTLKQKMLDFIQQYRYSNMLSNVATHLINVTSNAFENTFSKPISELTASLFEFLGVRGKGRKMEDVFTYFENTVFSAETMKNAFKKAGNVFMELEDFKNQDVTRVRRDFNIPAGTKADGTARQVNISKIYRAPLRALESADSFFFEVVQQGELAKLVKNNGGKLTAKISRQARKTAEDSIFRMTKIDDTDGLISNLFKWTAGRINDLDKGSGGVIKIFVPFVNTLAVLSKKAMRRTPVLGLLDLFKLKKGKTGRNMVEDIAGVWADQALGTGVAIAGYKFAQNNEDKFKLGRLETSSGEQRFADAEGNNYMSIKVGDRWIDLDTLGPASLPFVMGMKFFSMKQTMDKESFSKMVDLFKSLQVMEAVKESETAREFIAEWMGTAVKESTNNEFARPFYDAVNTLSGNSQGNINTYIGGILRQFSPYSSFLGAVNKTGIDKRKTISPENFNEMIEYAFRDFINIPGSIEEGRPKFYSEGIEQKTDPDGIPLFYGDEDAGLGRRAIDAINPTRPQVRNEDISDKRKEEKDDNVLKDDIKELDGEFTKQEERRIVNIIDKAETFNSVTSEEYNLLKQLPPQQLESFRKDWFKEENSELLLIYKKAQQSGNISKKDFERLSNISPELQKKIQESYIDTIRDTDILIVEKAIKTGDISKKDYARMQSLDPQYLQDLQQEFYKKEARARKRFNKEDGLYN